MHAMPARKVAPVRLAIVSKGKLLTMQCVVFCAYKHLRGVSRDISWTVLC